jgi:patatin-related protein
VAIDTPSRPVTDETLAPDIPPPPALADLREVRLAIVMYGGVSLSIYMNGVAQELLALVRATAPAGLAADEREHVLPLSDLKGTEVAYRKLSQLHDGDDRMPDAIEPGDDVVRRFVIDILSGASAGGINAIFLAKALANAQSMSRLTDLWIQEGDISKLINDRRSLDGFPRTARVGQPQALLNGRRMYRKLLEAFDGMDGDRDDARSTPATQSPYLDQLDLFVTTTDLLGLELSLQIGNGVVEEPRYRNVFHFTYSTEDVSGTQINDFHAANNPFLAFAARCTSAFPFAFEPMTLEAISEELRDYPRYRQSSPTDVAWRRFYPVYLKHGEVGGNEDTAAARFAARQFGDGGSLDNKPFTWATESVLRRRADNPVDRKLVFVDPDPVIAAPQEDVHKVDILENAMRQVVTLPRQETVRSDLEAVLDRNEAITRLDRLLLDVELHLPPTPDEQRETWQSFTSRTITEEAEQRGPNYAAYRRLRVETVAEDLAALLSRVAGVVSTPALNDAVRYLVEAWRDDAFPDEHDEENGTSLRRRTLTWFLFAYDAQYRIRRLNLLKRKLDRLYPLDEQQAHQMLIAGNQLWWPEPSDEAGRTAFRQEVLRIKKIVNHIDHEIVRPRIRAIANTQAADGRTFRQLVATAGITAEEIDGIVCGVSEGVRRRMAADVVMKHEAAFTAVGAALSDFFLETWDIANTYWTANVERANGGSDDATRTVRAYVIQAHRDFEVYDSVAFPMMYGTDMGEADVVEILRISPVDARSLIDVSKPGARRKVSGARYGHFGAFLDELWRKNDILWGRLDAAEILIRAFVPDDHRRREEVIKELRDQAHVAIVRQHFDLEERREIAHVVSGALSGSAPSAGLRQRIEAAARRPVDPRLHQVLELVLEDDERLLEYMRDDYQVPDVLPAGPTIAALGRALHVTGDALRASADQRQLSVLTKPFFWIAKVGQLLAGAAEASLPGSWTHLLVRHWLALLYLFEASAFLGGLLLGTPQLQQFGLAALGVTFLLNAVLWTVAAYVHGSRQWAAVVVTLVGAVLVGLVALAWLELLHLGRVHAWIPFFGGTS